MKENLRSKTFWTGIVMVGLGIYRSIEGDAENGMELIVEGIGLIFLRSAVRKSA